MTRIWVSVAGGLLLAAAAFATASAQTYDRRVPQPFAPSAAGGQTVCVPWCQHDESPCDPTYFKLADRRCSRPFEMNR